MTHRPSTDDLIRTLAASPPPPQLGAWGLVLPMLASVGIALGLFMVLFGPRADLVHALARPTVAAKTLLPLALALVAMTLAVRSTRPARSLRRSLLALPVAVALALFVARLIQLPSGLAVPELIGSSAAACLLSITALSLPATLVGLVLFRSGASPNPAFTGAMIGVSSAAGAAAGYALHCTEDSPLFFTTWYGAAILAAAVFGGAAGRHLLRW